MKYNIPLAVPTLGSEEIKAVTNVVKSNWLTMGPVVEKFEKLFADKLGVKFSFAVSNCTAALHMACMAIGIGHGDEVLCPVLSFVATANAIEYTGARAVFINPKSNSDLTMDPVELEGAITAKTKAIMVMHYGGYSVDMSSIMDIAKRYRLKVIEDCAHSIFGKNDDDSFTGTKGDVACFSFYGNKNMTTGEGGMVVTGNEAIAENLRLYRSHGMTTLSFDRFRGHASSYDVKLLGYNYRMDDLRASIGLSQLAKIDDFNSIRRRLVKEYFSQLKICEEIIIPFEDRDTYYSACHLMVIIPKSDPSQLREYLSVSGVQTSKHYPLITSFEYYKSHHFKPKDIMFENIVTLPLYPGLKLGDVDQICGLIKQFYD